MKAARTVGARFYPISPGYEEESWERLRQEGLDRFFSGEYAGRYEDELIEKFNKLLPNTPPWKRG
jgi:hypothetical protein